MENKKYDITDSKDLADYTVSIKQIEQMSSIKFFIAVPKIRDEIIEQVNPIWDECR